MVLLAGWMCCTAMCMDGDDYIEGYQPGAPEIFARLIMLNVGRVIRRGATHMRGDGEFSFGSLLRQEIQYLRDYGSRDGVEMKKLNCEFAEVDDKNKEEICSICLESMGSEQANSNKLVKLPCKHIFHADCLKPWIEKHLSCPNCKSTACRPNNVIIQERSPWLDGVENVFGQRAAWLLSTRLGTHFIRLIPILIPTVITGLSLLFGYGGADMEMVFCVFLGLIPLFMWVSFMSSLVNQYERDMSPAGYHPE